MFRANSDESYKMSASKSNKKDKDLEQRISKRKNDKIISLFLEKYFKYFHLPTVFGAGVKEILQSHLICIYLNSAVKSNACNAVGESFKANKIKT